MNKLWKEAASIIIAGRTSAFKTSKFTNRTNGKHKPPDYKLLVLKRGKSSRAFPGGYVFPGGTTEEADGSQEWLNIHESLGFKSENLNTLMSSSPKVPLFTDTSSPVHKSVALRITAVRETFEESGILLCKTKSSSTSSPSSWASYFAGHQLQSWQKTVQNNANDFLTLCKEFECFPDVWSLHQWSNWLTPTHQPLRFDTAFFLVTLDQLPPSFMNELEMDDMKWCSPDELLHGIPEDSSSLPPPQYYELSRIATHRSIEELNNFATQRSRYGCERWMPIQKKADDGIVCFLPGDDEYPKDVEYNVKTKMSILGGTMENLRQGVDNVHRIELHENEGAKIFVSNVKSSCGHVLPISNSKQ